VVRVVSIDSTQQDSTCRKAARVDNFKSDPHQNDIDAKAARRDAPADYICFFSRSVSTIASKAGTVPFCCKANEAWRERRCARAGGDASMQIGSV
jgi:hypothetical protein